MEEFTVRPQPDDPRLTRPVAGIDHEGRSIETAVVMERPLTLFLNGREIVTMMTIGDHPDYLAVGYLLNQNMLRPEDRIIGIDYDDELETVVVRTDRETDFEDKLKKKTLTSGCAQGTVFGDLMEKFEEVRLDPAAVLRTSWLYALTRKINTAPSLYLAAGRDPWLRAVRGGPAAPLHGGCRPAQRDRQDRRLHALNRIAAAGKIFYTTGRLTSEMVIKTVQMAIPILISRSGFTAWGVDLARQAGLTLIGRAKGKRFVALAGAERIVFDGDLGGRRGRAPGSPARRASPRTRHEVVGFCSPAGSRAAWAAATRHCASWTASAARPGHRAAAAAGRRARAQRQWRPGRFAGFGLPVADSVPDFAGPLAGRARRARLGGGVRPDCPSSSASRPMRRFCPPISSRGSPEGIARSGADLACAASGGRSHRCSGCGRCGCARICAGRSSTDGIRKVDQWTARHRSGDGAVRRSPGRPVLQCQPAGGSRSRRRAAETRR